MFKNYIKIAWRNLCKNAVFSAVNIVGLSVGLAFALLIFGYVWTELHVNKGLRNSDRQYILQSKWKNPNMGMELTTIGALPKALKEEYSNLVANYFRWDGIGSNVSNTNKVFRENLQISDSTMINMYGFKVLYGDAKTALNQPFTVVITSDIAQKYFGKTDVIGQSLQIESFSGTKHGFMITGVLETPSRNSVTLLNDDNNNHIFIPVSSAEFFGRRLDNWNNFFIPGYIELREGVNPADLEKPIRQLISQNTPAEVSKNLNVEIVQLQDYYLNANSGLVKKLAYTLSFAAFFIMLMAVVNFVNISINKSASRQKEIGVRKVMGGLRKELILQFLVESFVLTSFATCLALLMYQAFRVPGSNLLGKEISGFSDYPFYFFLMPFIIVAIVSLVAGVYPALFLSSFNPVDSLKGNVRTINKNVLLRKSLICFQFSIALIVLVGSIVISRQVDLFFSSNIGYNKDFVISAPVPRDWSEKGVSKMKSIRDQFLKLPGVENVSLSYQMPNGNYGSNINLYITNPAKTAGSLLLIADEHYAEVYGLSLLAGTFLPAIKTDADLQNVVINETQMKALGFRNPAEAIGKQLKSDVFDTSLAIVGVVKDFHFGSMEGNIGPLTFVPVGKMTSYRFLSFKVRAGSTSNSIAALQKRWTELLPGSAFEYSFMDDELKKMYTTEIRLKKASFLATFLCIIIVLMGVLSLISSSIQIKTKEIGIRKVLGASIPSLIYIFLKEFLVVMLFASFLAIPIAYFLMQHWLNSYAYRIDLTGQPFILSVTGLMMLTGIIILIQTIKVALANPVKSLRTE